MSIWTLAIRSLCHFWRTNVALMLGVAVGTAVLTGALIVGDSVRGSLKSLTIERLGRIDEILIGEQFFRAELANSLNSDDYAEIMAVILLNQTTVELDGSTSSSRAKGVTLMGAPSGFWDLRTTGRQPNELGRDQIVINQALADELGASIGDRLLIRVGKPTGIAADSPLARKSDLVKTLVDLELTDILPTAGLGRFSLQASQQVPVNAFVSLETLQRGLEQAGKVNAILVAGKQPDAPAPPEVFSALQKSLAPTIEDFGLSLKRVSLHYEAEGEQKVVADYDTLINSRMLFTPENEQAVKPITQDLDAQPVFTYLATKIQKLNAVGEAVGDIVPYSTITGVNPVPNLGPLVDASDKPIAIRDDGIVLNSWTAEVLDAKVGDRIRVTFFEPETTHGPPEERSADFSLQSIANISYPARPFSRRRDALFEVPPTLANDPDLTPEVAGITDAETIDKWDAPFPMDRSLLKGRDDDYWVDFRTTPKAFVSLETGRRLWTSRFGQTTSYRLPVTPGLTLEDRRGEISRRLASQGESFGLTWLRAKRDGLAASQGTTPFDALFFGFSMFIIASALMLVSLLLRLSMEQRASQIGLVGSLGFDWKRSLCLFLWENALIVFLGSGLGVLLGIGYAWLMLAGLRTWWVEAIVVPFMQLQITSRSLAIGLLLGILTSLITITMTLFRLRKVSLSRLLAGKTEEPRVIIGGAAKRRWISYAPWALLGLAGLLGVIAPRLAPEPQGGAFFGSGSCVLAAILLLVARRLQSSAESPSNASELSLLSLAARNLTRNPTRSTLTIGLVSSACFLIIAISAFRLAPTDEGTGGFELVGQSDQPIFEVPTEDESTHVFPLRLQAGEDASCRNLYQSSRPQLIGISEDFINNADSVGQMEWAGTIDVAPGKSKWSVLASDAVDGEVIPVVLDKNTAMYSMQLYGGVGTEFERDYGAAGVLKFRIVGLLSGSIFQGSLLVPEAKLLEQFPRVGGFRFFLVDTKKDRVAAAAELEEMFSDQGLDLTDSEKLLAELLSVQNTYLSTFQSLGGLGLLLGTFGLAAVQLRNVIQRRGELALLRATGFRSGQLSLLILCEHVMLLFGGLAVGTLAALVVVFPHLFFGGASVPIVSLIVTLGLVAIVGLVSAIVAQRYLQSTPLLPALRGD